jgi:bacterial/archaeal transporter family-2 protein
MNPGILYAIAAGLMISLQNVFVTRTGERVGFWEANTFVHGFGFLLALAILMTAGRSNQGNLLEVPKIYWIGLFIGVLIVFSVMQGVMNLGVGYAVPIILTAQILASAIISRYGFFGEKMAVPSLTNLLGMGLLIGGVVLTQVK